MRGLDVMRGLAGLMMSLLALAAAAPGVAGGVGGVAGGSGVVGGGLGGSTAQTGTGSPPVSWAPLLMGGPSLAGPPPSHSLAGAPSPTGGPSLAGPPCAAATAQTVVSIDGNVAERIYRDELVGSGTIADQHQVEGNGPLLKALARVSALAKDGAPVRNGVPAKGSATARRGALAKGSATARRGALAKGSATARRGAPAKGNEAGDRVVREAANAVTEAVHGLVYSHTHIVRLRVTQGGKLLADIGGPYIIAPVGGSLRFHGRVVGTYLLSVQDDLGFVGLERRLIGIPLILHVGAVRVPLQGTTRTGSVAIPDRGAVVIRGAHFQAYSFDAKAFPTGVVRISLLLPAGRGSGAGGGSGVGGRPSAGGGSALSCAAVKVAEVGRIARLIWLRFVLDGTSNSSFVTFTQSHTGALTYLREGLRQIAGSTEPGPPALPESGTVRYRGTTYGVTSFIAQDPAKPTRVPMRAYELVVL
jgi:hypothetical protein